MTKIDNHNGERRRQGRIEVICGSMFSGKTEELIRRMKRAKFAKQRVEIFKPSIDTRYSDEDVVSHDQNSIHSTPIDSSGNILLLASDIDVVPALCAIADEVTKVHAICVKCGALAYVSHRLIADDRRVMLGEQQEYEPLCRDCYKKATQDEANKNV